MARADRVAEVLGAGEVLEERPGAYRDGRARGAIALEDVDFAYEPGRPVLRGLSLQVAPGERVSLVGPSGAGKSTVAALVARFYDPQAGRVTLDGRDLRDCSLEWLRGQVGVLLQDPILFTGTIAENIGYGVDATAEEIAAAATAAGAADFVERLPDGYETMLGARGEGLSGGQKQRLAIARTLLRDPPVLLLDEPTTGLDAKSEEQVVAGLERLMRDRTVILVTHSSRLTRLADRTVTLEDGQLATRGAPRPRRIARPRDPALPALSTLLDPDAMAERLGASLGRGLEPTDVEVRYLRYKPGTNIVVQYDVGLAGARHDAIAMTAAGSYLARRAAKPENLALASLVNGRIPTGRALSYDQELRALVQWFPLDLSLPALAQPRSLIRSELAAAGAQVDDDWQTAAVLAYKPRRRAVLRLGGDVVKFYAKDDEYAAAARGLAASARAGVRAPAPGGVLPARRVTLQRFLAGTQPRPEEAAEAAGALLAELHASNLGPLPAAPPRAQLRAAAATAGLLAALSDDLGRRAQALLERLAAEIPAGLPPVAAHGDFNSRQLLASTDGLGVVDFDGLCQAPAALDLATYAAYVVLGGERAAEDAERVLAALLAGYGTRPPGLRWYLSTCILRRAARPFRYFEPEWPERVDRMLAVAEGVS